MGSATAAVWLWGLSLVGLWAEVFDASTPGGLVSLSMAMAGFALGLSVPEWVLRLVQTLQRWFRPRGSLVTGGPSPRNAPPLAAPAPGEMSRLLGTGLLASAGLSLLAAILLLAGQRLADRAVGAFLLSSSAYRVMQAVVELPSMLAWGVGAAVVWQGQSLARRSRGEEASWRGGEDWLWGLAAAGAVLALFWRRGWPLPAMGLAAGIVQVACGVAMISFPAASPGGPRAGPPTSRRPGAADRFAVLGAAAATALVLSLQARGLGDFLGVAMPGQILFGGGTVALAAVFHRRCAAAGTSLSTAGLAGAGLVASAGVGLELALGWFSLAEPGFRPLLWIALAGQAPFVAAAVHAQVSLRRRFAHSGGAPRAWSQRVLVGWAAGAMLASAALTTAGNLALWLFVLLACTTALVVAGIAAARRLGGQLAWAGAGGALLLAMTLGLTEAARPGSRSSSGRGLQAVSAGGWLTAWERDGECGYLPMQPDAPAWRLDLLAGQLLGKNHTPYQRNGTIVALAGPGGAGLLPDGPWLAVCTRPLWEAADDPGMVTLLAADPAVFGLPLWRGRAHGAALLPALRTLSGWFQGVLYAPMDAGHPAARAVFNREVLRSAATRLTAGGVFVLHAPCGGDNAAPMLAVARTVHEGLGESLLAIRLRGEGGELLSFTRIGVGEADVQRLAAALGHEAFVLRSGELADLWQASNVPGVTGFTGGPCGGGVRVTWGHLRHFLSRYIDP